MNDRLHDDSPISIRTDTVPPRMEILVYAAEVLNPLAFRQMQATCAAGDYKDLYKYLGYKNKDVNSAFDDAPYPLDINPFNSVTLKPERWLAAEMQEATAAAEVLHSNWIATMPDHLVDATLSPNLKQLVHHSIHPSVDQNNTLARLNKFSEANFLYHQGDKIPTAWLLNAEEEDAAKHIYKLYVLETQKLPPKESPEVDLYFDMDFLTNIFLHAKAFDVWRGLRRTCGLSDEYVAATWPNLYRSPAKSLSE